MPATMKFPHATHRVVGATLLALAIAILAPTATLAEEKKGATASTAVAMLPAAPSDFTVLSADKKSSFSLKDAKGKYVAIHFLLETECPYCMKHTRDTVLKSPQMPDVVNIFLKPDSEKAILKWESKLGPIGESAMGAAADGMKEKAAGMMDKAGGAKAAAEKMAAQVKLYRDPDAKLAEQFGIPGGYKFHGKTVHYPALVLLDPNGKEVFRYVGKDNSDRYSADKLAKKVADLKGGAAEKASEMKDGAGKMGDEMKAKGEAMKKDAKQLSDDAKSDAKKTKEDAKNRMKAMKDAWNNPASPTPAK